MINLLMSLWQIDEQVFWTADRHKALNFARNEVKIDFPDPYYWAAWVLLDKKFLIFAFEQKHKDYAYQVPHRIYRVRF